MAPGRITRHDIRQRCEDEGETLERWERRALLRVDQLWLDSQAEQYAARNKGR